MKRIALISFVSFVVLACNKGPVPVVKDPGPAQLPQGWTLFESSDKTVSMGIAPGWRKGGAKSSNMTEIATSGMGTEGMPQNFVDQMSQTQQADDAQVMADLEKQGIIISCIDSSRPIVGEERTRYNVKREKKGPMKLEDAAEEAKGNLIGEGQPQPVELPIGKAIRYDSTEERKDGGVVSRITYIVCNGEDVYTISFVTESAASVIQQVAEPVIQTLRIKPASGG